MAENPVKIGVVDDMSKAVDFFKRLVTTIQGVPCEWSLIALGSAPDVDLLLVNAHVGEGNRSRFRGIDYVWSLRRCARIGGTAIGEQDTRLLTLPVILYSVLDYKYLVVQSIHEFGQSIFDIPYVYPLCKYVSLAQTKQQIRARLCQQILDLLARPGNQVDIGVDVYQTRLKLLTDHFVDKFRHDIRNPLQDNDPVKVAAAYRRIDEINTRINQRIGEIDLTDSELSGVVSEIRDRLKPQLGDQALLQELNRETQSERLQELFQEMGISISQNPTIKNLKNVRGNGENQAWLVTGKDGEKVCKIYIESKENQAHVYQPVTSSVKDKIVERQESVVHISRLFSLYAADVSDFLNPNTPQKTGVLIVEDEPETAKDYRDYLVRQMEFDAEEIQQLTDPTDHPPNDVVEEIKNRYQRVSADLGEMLDLQAFCAELQNLEDKTPAKKINDLLGGDTMQKIEEAVRENEFGGQLKAEVLDNLTRILTDDDLWEKDYYDKDNIKIEAKNLLEERETEQSLSEKERKIFNLRFLLASFSDVIRKRNYAPIEIAIVDLMLRNGDEAGIEILRKIKFEFPRIRIVVISGRNDRQFEALSHGADYYITKPIQDWTRDFDSVIWEALYWKRVLFLETKQTHHENQQMVTLFRQSCDGVKSDEQKYTEILHNITAYFASHWIQFEHCVIDNALAEELADAIEDEHYDLILLDGFAQEGAHITLGGGPENARECHPLAPRTDKIRAILGKIRRALHQWLPPPLTNRCAPQEDDGWDKGKRLFKQIRRLHQEVPIILLAPTGTGDVKNQLIFHELKHHFRIDFDNFWVKPLSFERLREIKGIFEQQGLIRYDVRYTLLLPQPKSPLRMDEILDREGFCSKLKSGTGNCPAQKIMSLLEAENAENRQKVENTDVDQELVEDLNTILKRSNFYEKTYFPEISRKLKRKKLKDELSRLLEQRFNGNPLSHTEVARFNRLLLEESFPRTITKNLKEKYLERINQDFGGSTILEGEGLWWDGTELVFDDQYVLYVLTRYAPGNRSKLLKIIDDYEKELGEELIFLQEERVNTYGIYPNSQ